MFTVTIDDPTIHIVYRLTIGSGTYVGVTNHSHTSAYASVRARARKHWSRAMTERKDWLICVALRELGNGDAIGIEILDIVKGKAAAHKREVELRRQLKPTLNTDTRGD